MNDRDFDCWVAGFWEGEGSIFKKDKNCKQMRFTIAIGQSICLGRNVESIMEKIKKTYGGNIYRYDYPNCKTALQWRLDKRSDVIDFINRISPYCRIRKQDLIEVLKYYLNHPPLKNIFIDFKRVKELKAMGFTYEYISKIFNINRVTLYRRLKKVALNIAVVM